MKKIKQLEKYRALNFGSEVLYSVSPDTSLVECQQQLTKLKIHHLPVEDNSKVVGILSARDLAPVSNLQFAQKLVASDLMKKDLIGVDHRADLATVTGLMLEHQVGSVLLQEDNKAIGIFTTTDAMKALHEVMGEEVAKEKFSITFY